MLIRECVAADVELLERWDPTGPNQWHAKRLQNQEAGISTFLLAFRDGGQVGYGQILWGPSDPKVRATYPDCPEINGLGVYRELWGQGIGTALIRAAEERARRRGRVRIGLGVADDNRRAARLYAYLGYQPVLDYEGSYTFIDRSGAEHLVSEQVTFMIRDFLNTA